MPYWKLYYHFVWGTKSRLPLIDSSFEVKGNSSHFVNHVIKPDFEFYWQTEYGVLSFGEKNLSSVVAYIHNQKEHHAKGTLIESMEKMDEA